MGGKLVYCAAELAQTSAAFISELEPVATAGLAICLAYLALDRFRYRDEIQKFAIAKRNSSKMPEDGQVFESVFDLNWLCGDGGKEIPIPRGYWTVPYHHFFRKKIDELLITCFAAICAVALCAGVGIKIELISENSPINSHIAANIFYICCILALFLPPVSVFFGRKCVKLGEEFAEKSIQNIANSLAAEARQALPPVRAQS